MRNLLGAILLAMPCMGSDKVFLLAGDSIRHSYEPNVITQLVKPGVRVVKGNADAFDSRTTLQNIDGWLALSDHFDVIHFNCGLWDIRRGLTPSGNYIPVEEYRTNLEAIVLKFKATGARIIFATTTPVVSPANFDRQPGDVVLYNSVAIEVINRLGGEVNNLYEIADTKQIKSDGVHYSDAIIEVFSKQVIKSIAGHPKVEILPDASGYWVESWPACTFLILRSNNLSEWQSSNIIETKGVYKELFALNGKQGYLQTQIK